MFSAISLLNGEITADSVAARANASATGSDAVGSAVTNLVLLGQGVTPAPNQRFPLGDWGYAVTLELTAEAPVADDTRNARAAVTALHVVLLADHGGLPAGTEILIGHAEASSSTRRLPRRRRLPSRPSPRSPDGPPACRRRRRSRCRSRRSRTRAGPARSSSRRRPMSRRHSRRTATSSPSTGRRRSRTRSGRRAPASAGITARTSSRRSARRSSPSPTAPIFSVGWNDLGGYRLWLRDRQGNQFYYAHLSAFSPLAVDGGEVQRRSSGRLRRQHRRRAEHALPPALRDPSGRPAADGLRRRRQLVPVSERLAAAPGRVVRRRPRLGAARAADRDCAEASGCPARLDRHLERERARAGLARAGARRAGLRPRADGAADPRSRV